MKQKWHFCEMENWQKRFGWIPIEKQGSSAANLSLHPKKQTNSMI
jgi:hypothetical protein